VTGQEQGQEQDRPVLRIVRGDPSDEELAALVTVLAAAGSAAEGAPAATQESQWAAPGRLVRRAVHPTGWWQSVLPH
jgi:hypothetical protein